MKFNLKKWQDIQERRDDLYRKLHSVNDDRRILKDDFTRQQDIVLRNYDVTRERTIQKQIFIDRKLSYEAIHSRLELMKNNFEAVLAGFGLKQNTTAKHSLIELYGVMVGLKKLESMYEKSSSEINDYLASWNVLEEFAEHHIKMSRLGPTPIAEHSPQQFSSQSYPLA